MKIATLHSVQIGRVAPLGPDRVPSGFVKARLDGAVRLLELGIIGDEQADLSVHGGPDKAVYAYALSNYDLWRADFPEHAATFAPGSVGENLAIDGVAEADLCVGDVHAIGGALLQACQPRQPCFKFALRFGDPRLPAAMTINGRSGWYYRVLREGVIKAGADIILHERPNPDFPFARLVQIISRKKASPEEILRLARMDGLAAQWRDYFSERAGKSG